MKIAVIGSGISGLVATYLLDRKYDVTLFEKDSWVGGHTHTVPVNAQDGQHMIDTGFIVCNPKKYPNFIKLMQSLNIEMQQTSMSFSVTNGDLEYNGTNLNGLFAQRANLIRPSFYMLLNEIRRFNQAAKQFSHTEKNTQITMAEFLAKNKISQACIEDYILPILSAIWSNDIKSVGSLPAYFVCRFFNNHGLFNFVDRPQWYVVKGGSYKYVMAILNTLRAEVLTSTKITKVIKNGDGIELEYNSQKLRFDKVIIATHSDQALQLLDQPSEAIQQILGNIEYMQNEVVLHTDTRLLPDNRRAWAAWNYRVSHTGDITSQVTYNMNILQNLKTTDTYCVSLNQTQSIDPDKILNRFEYSHPKYTAATLEAQSSFAQISGQSNIYFCGAYWGYGFHEDGVNSALRVVNEIDKDILCKTPYTLDM